ncbi:DUF2897 family protein [Paraglaciecola sp. L3A3]|uniref:DUF2897 family protein n=1 Tax=Paraglaciecola sp. L3A3 TaxID=2686358 RepID=UPI00131C3ADF|nr:DUF2897 family protein [Paraglaciecola sp. L3A3]
MNTWIVSGIIILILGFIIGNILLLQQTAKDKLPKVKKDNNANYDRFEDNDQ